MAQSVPKYPVAGFRLPENLVHEFEKLAKDRGMTRQAAMIEMMSTWNRKQRIQKQLEAQQHKQ